MDRIESYQSDDNFASPYWSEMEQSLVHAFLTTRLGNRFLYSGKTIALDTLSIGELAAFSTWLTQEIHTILRHISRFPEFYKGKNLETVEQKIKFRRMLIEKVNKIIQRSKLESQPEQKTYISRSRPSPYNPHEKNIFDDDSGDEYKNILPDDGDYEREESRTPNLDRFQAKIKELSRDISIRIAKMLGVSNLRMLNHRQRENAITTLKNRLDILKDDLLDAGKDFNSDPEFIAMSHVLTTVKETRPMGSLASERQRNNPFLR